VDSAVAYQGEPGAYSEEGARALFPDLSHRPFPSIRSVFEAVEVGLLAFGLVPMDNSQAGSINETYDLFLRHGRQLVGETIRRVDHCLIALPGTEIDAVSEVRSHPQAVAQCEEFLHGLGVSVRADYNTAGAAKRIANEQLHGVAAIASRRAADLYGLAVLAEAIQTYPDNSTRFGALSRSPQPLADPDKSSLVFGVAHVPGSLYRCLGALPNGTSTSRSSSRGRGGRGSTSSTRTSPLRRTSRPRSRRSPKSASTPPSRASSAATPPRGANDAQDQERRRFTGSLALVRRGTARALTHWWPRRS
jgi:prephenate dehydratase